MDELDGDTGLHRPTVAGLSELGREQGEQWAEALAAGQQQVLGDLGQVGIVGGRGLEQTFLHVGERVPHPGYTNETLEVVHP